MGLDLHRPLSMHLRLGDLLVDERFAELAARLEPSEPTVENLTRLAVALDRVWDRFGGDGFRIVSGYRDRALNEAWEKAGLPASSQSLHMVGCAADLAPVGADIELDEIFHWVSRELKALELHEAVYYPRLGVLHLAVADREAPTPTRVLTRT